MINTNELRKIAEDLKAHFEMAQPKKILEPDYNPLLKFVETFTHDQVLEMLDKQESCIEMLKDVIRNSKCVTTKKKVTEFLSAMGEL